MALTIGKTMMDALKTFPGAAACLCHSVARKEDAGRKATATLSSGIDATEFHNQREVTTCFVRQGQ